MTRDNYLDKEKEYFTLKIHVYSLLSFSHSDLNLFLSLSGTQWDEGMWQEDSWELTTERDPKQSGLLVPRYCKHTFSQDGVGSGFTETQTFTFEYSSVPTQMQYDRINRIINGYSPDCKIDA